VLAPGLAAFPDQVRESALDSLAHALAVADQMGPRGARLAELAESAFIQSMDLSLLVLSILLAVAAAFVPVWPPGRDGQQLRPIRRLRSRAQASGHADRTSAVRRHFRLCSTAFVLVGAVHGCRYTGIV
jgi:hypothetical protein